MHWHLGMGGMPYKVEPQSLEPAAQRDGGRTGMDANRGRLPCVRRACGVRSTPALHELEIPSTRNIRLWKRSRSKVRHHIDRSALTSVAPWIGRPCVWWNPERIERLPERGRNAPNQLTLTSSFVCICQSDTSKGGYRMDAWGKKHPPRKRAMLRRSFASTPSSAC